MSKLISLYIYIFLADNPAAEKPFVVGQFFKIFDKFA